MVLGFIGLGFRVYGLSYMFYCSMALRYTL